MNIKELFENEELMNNIVEDIEEVPEDAVVTYEVWALGYGADDEVTDAEVLLGEFVDPDEAIACAEKLTLESVMEACDESEDLSEVAYFSLEVETVVEDEDDIGTMNIGSIYQRDLWIDGEYGSVEDAEPTIFIYNKDYELLEDGILKVRRELLKDYNKNDRVKLCFAEEDSCSLTYKIVSKVEYADGDYYHLDFIG
jgi:hypothetical protein